MTTTLEADRATVALACAHESIDDLFETDLGLGTDEELLGAHRELERLSRRLAAVEHAFIAQLEERSLPDRTGAGTTAALLRGLLRLHPAEAKSRVRAAEAAGPRRGLTGEPLPPVFEAVATAQAGGEISARHAEVVVRAVDALPAVVRVEHGAQVESDLVRYALEFDPHSLAKIAQRIYDCLDPDGTLHDPKDRERKRDLSLRQRPDGSASLTGELTAECAERLLGVFDALAAPTAEAGGVKDPRTAGQRRHDALLDALPRLCLTDALPAAGGIATTVIVTVSEESFRTGRGLAETSHDALVPAREALKWAGADQRVAFVRRDGAGAVTAHTDTRRFFSENQRLAILARDGGCTFPACDKPPAWTQVHHIIPWVEGGPTTIDNGAMICGYHHRSFERLGWKCVTLDGRPAWIPPRHVDPKREPRRNRLHEQPLRK
jgi:hypothetical protein